MEYPRSMTGFGRGEAAGAGRTWTVELRSVNHRYLDIGIKMPRKYAAFEERIRKQVAGGHARGRVDVYLSLAAREDDTPRLRPDLALAREYYDCLLAVRDELALDEKPDLDLLTANNDLIVPVEEELDAAALEAIWEIVREAVAAALEECRRMRIREGEALQKDLLARLAGFARSVDHIEEAVPDLLARREQGLKERLDNLLQGVDIDPVRLAQEVAVIADKSDVSEELVRLKSHIGQFGKFFELTEPVGRRCDFLLQEFLREVNTIASKINDADIAHLVVDMKNELEKMREQVQNLE